MTQPPTILLTPIDFLAVTASSTSGARGLRWNLSTAPWQSGRHGKVARRPVPSLSASHAQKVVDVFFLSFSCKTTRTGQANMHGSHHRLGFQSGLRADFLFLPFPSVSFLFSLPLAQRSRGWFN